MRVSQRMIAEQLGLDRTTVTKILNRDPHYSASEKTRELVFRTAEELGYDFTFIRRPFRREYGRTAVDAPCEMEMLLEDGQLFDRGEAVVRNISVGGALLTHIRTSRQVLPLANFTLRLKLSGLPELADLVGECEIVRLAETDQSREPELGVRFINATVSVRRRIKEFVERKIAAEQKRLSRRADN